MIRWLCRGFLFGGAALLVPACAPPPPVLQAVLASASQVVLSWSSNNVVRFTVERSTDGGSFTVLAQLPGQARSWTDTTVAGGTTYYYRLGGWYDEVAYSNLEVVTTPWAVSYGGSGDEDFFALAPAPDGGFLAVGETDPQRRCQWDGWLVRVDAEGSILWQKSLGTAKGEWIDHAEPTPDGGFILVGICDWTPGGGDGWVVRLDDEGKVLWQYTLGGEGYDELLGAAATPDGGFILSGYTFSAGAGGSDLWLVKMSARGAVEWQRTYGGPLYEGASFALPVRRTSDGGYVIVSAGEGTDPAGLEGAELWVLKVRAGGEVEWAYAYGGPGLEYGFGVQEASNGDLLVAGTTTSFGSGGTDFWILRLDSRGRAVWQQTFGGEGEDYAYWIREISGNDLLVCGITDSFGAGGVDYWLLRLRSDGRGVWQRTYGGPDHEWAYAMQAWETPDRGLVVAGSTRRGNQDGWILKLAADGTVEFDPASGYRTGITAVSPVSTSVRGRRIRVQTGGPGFPAVPYPGSAADTNRGARRQAP